MLDGDGLLALLPLQLRSAPTLDAAPWHASRPHLLANALTEVRRTVPGRLVTMAEELLPRLPRRPVASQNLRAFTLNPSSGPLLLDDAVGCPWICPNTEQGWNVIAIDVDHEEADNLAFDLERLGLPRPVVVMDPWSARAHVLVPLATPVSYAKGARLGPQILADLASRLLAAYFKGTPLPRAALVKSPWGLTETLIGQPLRRTLKPTAIMLWEAHQEAATGLMWHTIPGTGVFELRAIVAALSDYADEMPPSRKGTPFRKRRGDPSLLSRNDYVFDLTRWWAYDRCERDGGAIADEAQRINVTMHDPLPMSAVASTARSITKFMNSRFRPAHAADARRGRDRDLTQLPPEARKAAAGPRSAMARSAATDARIAGAVAELQASGTPLTQAAIAAWAKLGINTVARRWSRPVSPPFAALSGSAAPAAPGAVGPASPKTVYSSLSLSVVAARDRAIRKQVHVLGALAAAARRPGAVPVPVPRPPTDMARHPLVRTAIRTADAAVADARRRALARDQRAAALARGVDMEARLRADRRAAFAWRRRVLFELDEEWDARESDADPDALPYVRVKREATFIGWHRTWKSALRRCRP